MSVIVIKNRVPNNGRTIVNGIRRIVDIEASRAARGAILRAHNIDLCTFYQFSTRNLGVVGRVKSVGAVY